MRSNVLLAALAATMLWAAAPPEPGGDAAQETGTQVQHTDSNQGAAPVAPGTKCTLERIAALDMETEPDGEATIPVTVNSVRGRWMIDTGNVRSMISGSLARRLGIAERRTHTPMAMFGGKPALTEATIDNLEIDQMSAHNFSAMVAPASLMPTDTIGILSPDIMAAYDVDFDFAAGTFKVFTQNHCPGRVVYWTQSNYARVPFHVDDNGHVIVPITIDGKQVEAVIDTGTGTSTMTLSMAKSVFGVDAKTPGMTSIGEQEINSVSGVATYRYGFASLTFEGVAVSSPAITIVDDSRMAEGTTPLILGIQTLRQLHLYIAYGEKALYVTAAEAR